MKIKRIVICLVATMVFLYGLTLPSAFADEDYLLVKYEGYCLKIERVGTKFNTWGKYDVEAVQWDRIVKDNDETARIFLVVNGGTYKLNSFVTPGGTMVFYGSANGVACSTQFQIYADVWVGKKKVKKYWALGPNEPLPSVISLTGVKVVKVKKTYTFETSCCCNVCNTCQ